MAEPVDLTPDYCSKSTLILGCGNILLGDDGFGPEVVAYLESHYAIPEEVAVLDAGTGVGDILLDVALAERKPQVMVLVDILDRGEEPGSIVMLPPDGLPQPSRGNVSPHQVPSSGLLKELEALGQTDVLLLTVQPLLIPQEVQPGLSDPVRGAVPRACEIIARSFFGHA